MKSFIAFFLVLMFSMTAFADTGIDWTQFPDDELQATIDELTEMLSEANSELEHRKSIQETVSTDIWDTYSKDRDETQVIQEKSIKAVEDFTKIYKSCVLDRITVNPNLGTDKGGDFVVLVYMIYTIKTDFDRSMIEEFSEKIANYVSAVDSGIVEICVFWNLSEYDANGKVAFTVDNSGVHFDNEMLPLPDMPFFNNR